jgi:AcrR family transcriptional regulator
MIGMVGDHGLAALDVATLCERARASQAHFKRCFADLDDCFSNVHDETAADLCERVRTAYDGRESWHDRVWAAGTAAMRFLQEDAIRARFLLVAVNGAGAAARSRRDSLVRGLAELLDGGRGEAGRRGAMSGCTAEIAAGAVYGTAVAKVEAGSLERGEEFLPELVYLATMPYLGARAAEDELLVQPLR